MVEWEHELGEIIRKSTYKNQKEEISQYEKLVREETDLPIAKNIEIIDDYTLTSFSPLQKRNNNNS